MTVKELMSALAEMPPDAEVEWNDGEYNWPASCYEEWYDENGEIAEDEEDKFQHVFVICEELAGEVNDD